MPRKILIEYVSSNPTGPIHIGHGRGAAFGSALANLLRFTGDEVIEEYYINDRGLQTDVLALSVFLRYQELFKVKVDFPEECYQGDYIKECAFLAKEKFLDKYLAKKDLKFTDQSNPLDLINKIYIVFPNLVNLSIFVSIYKWIKSEVIFLNLKFIIIIGLVRKIFIKIQTTEAF